MRVLVFFDLPITTKQNRRDYSAFRKFLIKNGFVMMQMSVYSKIALTLTTVNTVVENIRKQKPPEGLIQVLVVTEKQFSKMEFILGTSSSDVITSDERLVVL